MICNSPCLLPSKSTDIEIECHTRSPNRYGWLLSAGIILQIGYQSCFKCSQSTTKSSIEPSSAGNSPSKCIPSQQIQPSSSFLQLHIIYVPSLHQLEFVRWAAGARVIISQGSPSGNVIDFNIVVAVGISVSGGKRVRGNGYLYPPPNNPKP